MNSRYYILFGSFVLSLLLWTSLNLNLVYELDYKVPVRVNVSKPYAVANPVPLFFDVKLRGKGWNYISIFTTYKPEFSYNIDSKFDNNSLVLPRQYLIENLGLSSNISVIEINPDTLIIRLDQYTEKYVRIIPDIKINCKEGYQTVGKFELEPDSIKIGGAVNILNSLTVIKTKPAILNDVSNNIYKSIVISDTLSNIIWKSRDEIFVRLKVELSAEKEIQNVNLKVKDMPADKDVILIPSQVTLNLRGGVNQLSEYDKDKINAFVNFNNLMIDTTGSVAPVIELPEGVKITNQKPERIQYIIKKK